MHADEAILADKFGAMLAGRGFSYDPNDYHGPVLAYLAWIPAHLTRRTTYEALTETTLRIAAAITGILLALSPLLLTPVIGVAAALAASALIAASPVMVYYSRDFIPEMPLALWTALFLIGLCKPGAGWRALAGAAAVTMIATKETALLAIVAALVAKLATSPRRPAWRVALAFGGGAVAAFCVLLARVNWALLLASMMPYTRKAFSGGLHQHPWYSYLQWIAGWHYSFTEAPILVLAAAGVAVAVKTCRPFVGFLAVYTLALLAEYSVLPYKTPWCAVSIVYGLALLAGVGAGALASKSRRGALAAVLFAVGVSAWQASVASIPAAASPRNPWAYAQTGNGVFSIRDRVDAAAHAAPEGLGVTIDVYTRDNWWPLPWYFRRCPHVRWWREVDLHGRAAPIVLLSPEMEPDLIRKLYEGPAPGERELYVNLFPEYVELRPQVEVRGYVAKSLWDRTPIASSRQVR